jgi:hypothetical protein
MSQTDCQNLAELRIAFQGLRALYEPFGFTPEEQDDLDAFAKRIAECELTLSVGLGGGNATNGSPANASALVEPKSVAPQKGNLRGAPVTQAAAAPRRSLSANAAVVLVDSLVTLASPDFQRKSNPPQKLQTAHEPSVHNLLGQVAEVVTLWHDQKSLPSAIQKWRAVRPQLSALLTDAADPKRGVVDSDYVKPALDAIAKITDFLSVQESDFTLEEAVKSLATPDLSKEMDARELKKLEPSLKEALAIISEGGPLVDGPKMKALEKAIKVYNSKADPSEKLAAFQNVGFVKRGEPLSKVAPFLIHAMVEGASEVNERSVRAADLAAKQAKRLAQSATSDAVRKGFLQTADDASRAASALKLRASALHVIGGAVGLYEVWKGSRKLKSGIKDGNWHMIAEGGATITIGAIAIAETLHLISASAGTALTNSTVAIWGVAEVVMMAAEQKQWAKKMKAHTALKSMIADARTIVPDGKRLSAALDLLLQTDGSTDPVESANNDRYQQYANQSALKVSNGIRRLVASHLNPNSLDVVGGYPVLMSHVRPMVNHAVSIMDDSGPLGAVTAFEAIVEAIKEMAATGDKHFGDV